MSVYFNIGDSQPGDVLEDESRQSGTDKDDNTCSIHPQQFEGSEVKYKLPYTLDPSSLHTQKPSLTRS